MQTILHLLPEQFSTQKMVLLESGEFSASIFRFSSGVCGLELKNSVGELICLPFQGQQIWDAVFRGRRLTMRSMFDEPQPSRDFLSTYGAFLLHCGATAMGVPGAEDTHSLHGELPNAPYSTASLVLGMDDNGEYIGLTGTYRHTVAFNYNYTATPLIKLYTDSSVLSVSMTIHNLKASPMPLMFLEHVNFKPVDGGRLVQSVICDAKNMRIRSSIPAFMEVPAGYREFVKILQENPEKHLVFDPDLIYDPEMVFYMNYLADDKGWARTMQVHPDGSADVLRHRPEQLDHGVRWICRTLDQDAIGIEPCTAEVEGYLAEKHKGNVRSLAGGDVFTVQLEIGLLTAAEVQLEEQRINRTLAGAAQ